MLEDQKSRQKTTASSLIFFHGVTALYTGFRTTDCTLTYMYVWLSRTHSRRSTWVTTQVNAFEPQTQAPSHTWGGGGHHTGYISKKIEVLYVKSHLHEVVAVSKMAKVLGSIPVFSEFEGR
jgi:hypothetical protein